MTNKKNIGVPDKTSNNLVSSKTNQDELNDSLEGAVILIRPRIQVFDSIEEMENHHYKHATDKDPVQGLKETVELILRAYGLTRDDLKNRIPDNSIKIKYYR